MKVSKPNKPKPRLLVLASTYPRWANDPEPGFVHELAKRLVGDFEVTVLGPHAPGAASNEVLDGVRVRRYRYAPAAMETLVNDGGIVTNLQRRPWKWLLVPGFLIGLVWSLWRLNRQWRPEVIHAHWLLPQGLAIALLSKLGLRLPPFVVTSHGADLFALRAKPLQALKRLVVSQAAAVTVVSNAMRDELRRLGAYTSKVSVQPMGVDLSQRFTLDTSIVRSEYEILFVGRLVEKKGLRHLIDAMPGVLAQHPQAILTIAGFGPEAVERQRQVALLGLEDKVTFLGATPQSELPRLYRRAAVFVAPFVETGLGDQEGLGLVLVEALGCGCPVITTRLPAVREVLGDNWHSMTVEPGRVTELADRICGVLTCRAGVPPELLISLRKRFDWGRTARGYVDLLHAGKSA